jgi:hypothetical protein
MEELEIKVKAKKVFKKSSDHLPSLETEKFATKEELENEENTMSTNIQFMNDYNAVSKEDKKLQEHLNQMKRLL